MILKLESRAMPYYVGIGNIHWNIKHIINIEYIPQSHIKQEQYKSTHAFLTLPFKKQFEANDQFNIFFWKIS